MKQWLGVDRWRVDRLPVQVLVPMEEAPLRARVLTPNRARAQAHARKEVIRSSRSKTLRSKGRDRQTMKLDQQLRAKMAR